MNNSTLFVLLILVFLIAGSCSLEPVPQESTEREPSSQNPKSTHLPYLCRHLYNIGRHRDWAMCMGVGYVPKAD